MTKKLSMSNASVLSCGLSIDTLVSRLMGLSESLSPDTGFSLTPGSSLAVMAVAVPPPMLVSVMALLFSSNCSELAMSWGRVARMWALYSW